MSYIFNAIIAILHVKIETLPHSLKNLQCQYECLFSLKISLQTQMQTWLAIACMNYNYHI